MDKKHKHSFQNRYSGGVSTIKFTTRTTGVCGHCSRLIEVDQKDVEELDSVICPSCFKSCKIVKDEPQETNNEEGFICESDTSE